MTLSRGALPKVVAYRQLKKLPGMGSNGDRRHYNAPLNISKAHRNSHEHGERIVAKLITAIRSSSRLITSKVPYDS